MSEYEIHIPGLAAAISGAPPTAGHAALLRALRKLPELARLRLATPAHDDGARCTLAPACGVPARRTGMAHRRASVQDSEPVGTGVSDLYLVTDNGGDPADFIQICLRLGTAEPAHRDRKGPPPQRYQLVHAIDMGRLVALAQSLDRSSHAGVRPQAPAGRPPGATAPPPARTGLRPRTGCNATRIFSDWYNSSAGRSGARLCDHWIMRFADWTDPHTAQRKISLMPGWTSPQTLHEVRAERGNVRLLYRQLQHLDQRMGVPFSWFFHMLVGSRVQFDAGYHVLSAAEQGQLAMPDHDARVLRDWWARPYGY